MEEPSKQSDFPKNYDPLSGDQPRKEIEEFQLKANEGPGIFPQGEAGLDSNQGEESFAPPAAAEFSRESTDAGSKLQPSAFSGSTRESSQEFVSPAMMQPQSEAPSDVNKPEEEPLIDQQFNVDQPDKAQFENKGIGIENIEREQVETESSQTEKSQALPSLSQPPIDAEKRSGFSGIQQDAPEGLTRFIDTDKMNIAPKGPSSNLPLNARPFGSDELVAATQRPIGQEGEVPSGEESQEGQNQTDLAKRNRMRKLGAAFSMDRGQEQQPGEQQPGEQPQPGEQQQPGEGEIEDKIPEEFLESVSREVAADIQSQEARHLGEGGVTHKGGYGSQARAAAARNEPLPPLQGGRRRSRKYSNTLELASGHEDIGQAVHITVDLDKVTREEAAALQSIEAKFHGGVVPKGSLAAAAQAAAALNETPSPPASASTTPQRRRSSVNMGQNAPGQPPQLGHQPIAPVGAKGQTVHPHSCGLHVEQVADNALLIEANFDRITREDAAFIQALEAKLYGGVVPRGSLAAQAQAAAARNEPIPGQQPLQQSPPPGFNQRPQGRRVSLPNRQPSWQVQGQQQGQGQGPERVAEDIGHIHIEADLDKVSRQEAAVLQSAEAQLHQGIIPKGSIGAAAQSAAIRNEPWYGPGQQGGYGQQQGFNQQGGRRQSFPSRQQSAPAQNLADQRVAEDRGNIHLEADLSTITRQEAAVLQSMEAQLQPSGLIPKGSVAAAAQSHANRNEPLPGRQPFQAGGGGGRRQSFGNRQQNRQGQGQWQGQGQNRGQAQGQNQGQVQNQGQIQGQNQPEELVVEDLGHIRLGADLDKVTRHEAAVLQSAEAQLNPTGLIPKGSVAAAAQAAAAQHEPPFGPPQVVLEPIRTAEVDEETWTAKEDIGHIHVEVDLDKITPHEASVLQSIEAQMEGIAPRGGLASLAMSSAMQQQRAQTGQVGLQTQSQQQARGQQQGGQQQGGQQQLGGQQQAESQQQGGQMQQQQQGGQQQQGNQTQQIQSSQQEEEQEVPTQVFTRTDIQSKIEPLEQRPGRQMAGVTRGRSD